MTSRHHAVELQFCAREAYLIALQAAGELTGVRSGSKVMLHIGGGGGAEGRAPVSPVLTMSKWSATAAAASPVKASSTAMRTCQVQIA